ncbi:Universal stress protein family protein [Minicystis rosea]|nr:Universal stress protein family protein [Minicystis rosea]
MDRILVGLDASPRADGVLETAVDLARRTGGKLILCRAVGIPHEIPAEAYTMTPASLAELLEREAQKDLNRIAATLPEGMVAALVVHVGTPWQGLCAAADQHDADLIVIGSHGYSGIDKLIGTTAAKVVNHAKQSVLVVRGHPSFTPA